MAKQYTDEYFLFGTHFKQYKNDDDQMVFDDWHQSADLTAEETLSEKIRPIPYAPVMVNALTAADNRQLWATDHLGKLMNLGLGQPSSDSLVPDPENPQTADTPDLILLHHGSRVTRLNSQHYELSFPPVKLLAHLISNTAISVTQLGGALKSLAKEVLPKYQGINFTPTQILPSQLAPAYQASIGSTLKDDQLAYNNWREEKMASPEKPIKGFVVPSYHTLAVVFSDPLYNGAEVSLIRPIEQFDADNPEAATEDVVASAWVTKVERQGNQDYLPCALFNLDPEEIDTGFYLLRIKFWRNEYERANQGAKLPDSVTKSNLSHDFCKREVDDDRPQDVYSYELHERLVFRANGGLGKIAHVCGDMLSLEELIIHQFPNQLPEYQDYVSEGQFYQADAVAGIGAFSLSTQAIKTYDALANDVSLMDGLAFINAPAEIAATIGSAFKDNIDQAFIPEIAIAGIAFREAVSANREAFSTWNQAQRIVRQNLTFERTLALIFKKYVADGDYLSRELEAIKRLYNNRQYTRVVGRLSQSWGSLTSTGLPALATATEMMNFYNSYQTFSEMKDSADSAFKQLEDLSQSYLEQVTFVHKSNAKEKWKNKAQSLQDRLGETARIRVDKQGIALNLNFQFNSAEVSNELKPLHNDFAHLCETLCRLLEDNLSYQVVIEGHAGPIGSEKNNRELSKRRAEFVTEAILSFTQDTQALKKRIHYLYFGSARRYYDDESQYQDHDDRSDSADIAIDRRVEVRLVVPDFAVSLPPSRTGSLKLESMHQLWQGYLMDAEKQKGEMLQSAIGGLCGIAMFTPLAPAASAYFIGSASLDVLDTAFTLLDEMYNLRVYNSFKEMFEKKSELQTLDKINRQIMREYRNINTSIEAQELNAEQLADHLGNQDLPKELLKRFLLRAYAINNLIELLTRIRLKETFSPFATRESVVKAYQLDHFIETYVMSDNWEIPEYSYNSLAQNWLNRFSVPLSRRGLYSADRKSISGSFHTGFPVQTAVYLDKGEKALERFSKDFDMSKPDLTAPDVGFSRLLVFDDVSQPNRWRSHADWLVQQHTLNKPSAGKIGPFTRVKIQVLLNAAASEDSKTLFHCELSYEVSRLFFDIEGPSYSLLMGPKQLDDFTLQDSELESYFARQGSETLTGFEFEPTYWFGALEIPGLKPLYQTNLIEDIRSLADENGAFDLWVESNGAHQLEYLFKLNGEINLAPRPDTEVMALTREVRDMHARFDYGVFDESESKALFDGQHMQKVRLKGSDLLIEDFITSTSVNQRENTPAVVGGDLILLPALKVGSELKFFKQGTPSSMSFEQGVAFDNGSFDWSKETPSSLYIAVISDEFEKDTYQTMRLDPMSVPVEMQLGGLDQCAGPRMASRMHYVGQAEIGLERPVAHPYETPSYTMTWKKKATEDEAIRQALDADLVSFAGQALEQISQEREELKDRLMGSSEKFVHVMKFDLVYVAPNGRKLYGLRPFGDIVSKGGLKRSEITVLSVNQRDIASDFELDIQPIALPASKSLVAGMPWSKNVQSDQRYNESAARHWSSLDDEQKRSEWLENWITKETVTLEAPVVKLKV
ncbi:OmpA family protein [Vibrio ostreicida]|uniref:OmpA family protein n=1 Tax=Vibrio ostreicida TaxID=526588 RepID=A0ABT8BXA6_9VIBR|nr:OmpA family protein [Vibrio ostreicida]MDN3611304.1 OmpA family protein [Vibrio ostreicida]NPD09246.1 OmpA family protein [Vibrio ostreicida]